MSGREPTRYQMVSRRAMLKTSLGTGVFLLVPGLACGNDDATILADATAEPPPVGSTTGTTTPTATDQTGATEPVLEVETAPETTETTEAAAAETTAPTEATQPAPTGTPAVNGELVIAFTYTQGLTGKNEWPYIAVWIEDAAGELLETVSLWYEQGRRGARWLDHLNRWYEVDLARQTAGGIDAAATISSATRAPGSYVVAWDGLVHGEAAEAGDYFVCVEAAREEGPYSLIRQPFTLAGSLAETALPDDGELSAASVRIDG
jgi:hypothetical protein